MEMIKVRGIVTLNEATLISDNKGNHYEIVIITDQKETIYV